MNRFPLVSMVKINRARNFFFASGSVPSGLVPDEIVRSWQRSVNYGVPAEDEFRNNPVLSNEELACLKGKNRTLLNNSLPVMENLYEQIIHTSSVVLLADADGTVLHSVGDPKFIGKTSKVSLQPGGIWSEAARGTNAIGTALFEQSPIVVHSAEHFVTANHFLSCSASPIFDPHGKVLGVLDVSGDGRVYQQHTMALVRISAQQIENQMFSAGFELELVLHFHARPEFVGTLYEGIAVFSQDGRFLAANRSALLHLGIERNQVMSASFATLFETPLKTLLEQAGPFPQAVHQLRTNSNVTVYCRVKTGSPRTPKKLILTKQGSQESRAQAGGGSRLMGLEELELGDPGMQKIIVKIRKVLGHDISVMIEGESGTGKELFAQAMHHSSLRRNGPFVALNCAALPESLIEAELFGYQDGAFTGARRKGYLGKIRQADGGTLFLDEIGDMPLQLQARLLRVLQERAVTPLGDTKSYQVDFALVCATNRKIRDEIATGRFREDLYYRLNGLLVSLPPLKERADLLALARSIIDEMVFPGRTVRMSQEVIDIFKAYPWPGNIRQMRNVLRTAVVLLGLDNVITVEHLPEDFFEQCQQIAAPLAKRLIVDPDDTAESDSELSYLNRLEILAIRKTLQECGGNISATARKLGICRNTLYRKLQDIKH